MNTYAKKEIKRTSSKKGGARSSRPAPQPVLSTDPWLDRTVVIDSAIVALIALLGLLGNILGLQILASIRLEYIPMASITAVCFLVLCAALSLHVRKIWRGFGRILMIAPVLLVTAIGLSELLDPLLKINLGAHNVLNYITGMLGMVQTGQMSSVSGAAFFVAGLGTSALLLCPFCSRFNKLFSDCTSSFGVVTALIGGTVLLAYVFGTPLMYGTDSVPMAETTAVAFMFLGVALSAASGPESFPLRLVIGDTTGARLSRIFLPLVIISVLAESVLFRFIESNMVSHALLISFFVVVTGMITAIIAARASRSIGKSLDESTVALKEAKMLTDAIIENIPLMIFLKDAKDLTFVLFNRAGEDLVGFERKDMIGKSDLDFFPPDQAKFFIDKDHEVLDKESGYSDIPVETITTAKKGDRLLHTQKVRLRGADGTVKYLLGISEDITDRMQIDRAKTEFVSLASHQLRTPTTVIKWYSEMLLEGDAGPLNEEQMENLRVIHHGNHTMIDLIDALLNVSRIDLGTFYIKPEPTDVALIADDVLKEVEIQTAKKKIEVIRKLGKTRSKIISDPKLVRIILQNLLSNAVSYTPSKGKISVEIKKADAGMRIEVSDTGCGIPASEQPKIYTKFFRADNARLVRPDGTGLGLYITRSIVLALGGTIDFTSREGAGTTFTVVLPAKSENREGTKMLG